MKIYNVEIAESALADIDSLAEFLVSNLSIDGAKRYLKAMLQEINSLSIFADLYKPSTYAVILRYHPKARRMVSHNKKWVYIFHVENDTVVIDRIRPLKLITQ